MEEVNLKTPREIIELEFDKEFYLSHYPEVAQLEIDPIDHYIKIGAYSGYDPSSNFSSEFYLSENKRVAELKINPLVHYIKHGRKEGRKIQKSNAELPEINFENSNHSESINLSNDTEKSNPVSILLISLGSLLLIIALIWSTMNRINQNSLSDTNDNELSTIDISKMASPTASELNALVDHTSEPNIVSQTETPIPPTNTSIPIPSETSIPSTSTRPTIPSTLSPTPTNKPLPTVAPTSVPEVVLFNLTVQRLVLRSEPTSESEPIVTLTEDLKPFRGIGRNVDGSWMQIRIADGREGWVSGQYVTTEANPFASLPIINLVNENQEEPTQIAQVNPTAIPPTPLPQPTIQTINVDTIPIILVELNVPRLVLRELPSTDSTALITLSQDILPPRAIARNADATWLKVQLDNGQFGWLFTEFLTVGGDPFTLPEDTN